MLEYVLLVHCSTATHCVAHTRDGVGGMSEFFKTHTVHQVGRSSSAVEQLAQPA